MEKSTQDNKRKKCYCHFSFRRPRGKGIGIFAAALYADYAGTRKVELKVRQFPLWEDHQFTTAIQAYEHALRCIWEWQGSLMDCGITDVELVTDNRILAGWILDHRKNKCYTEWMNKAVAPYKVGGAREIMLAVGLDRPRDYEKSYKYCLPEMVENQGDPSSQTRSGVSKWKISTQNLDYQFIDKMAKELEVDGIELPQARL